MNIYINGDSHSAGAELYKGCCFADDDPLYSHLGGLAHPKCIELSYGYKLASSLNAGFFCEAVSASSNDRIMRKTKEFLSNLPKGKTVIVIGWSTWEREEWLHKGTHYQLTASGTDAVPEELSDRYKQWVVDQTPQVLEEKQKDWHTRIHDLHLELYDRKIKHLFFNTFNCFTEEPRDWHDCYVKPYNLNGTYYHWLKENGFNTVNPDSYHYGRDAHSAWAKHILPRLTNTDNSSTIKIVTQTVTSQGARKT